MKSNPERISKIKLLRSNYNCKERSFPSQIKKLKEFESNNKSMSLTVYLPKMKKVKQANIPKYSFNHENKVILWMIADGKKLHYLAIKSLSR